MISKLSFYRERDPGICFNPYHNLAVEKYLTYHAAENECILFLWQNRRSVVIGKNQNVWKECNITRLQEDGGFLVRRLSGGGAVYHDSGNLNFSFCARDGNYDVPRQTEVILRAVRSFGIPAVRSGRNDLLSAGRKFSGHAFYKSGSFCCHHGTVMINVSPEEMSRYLNVDRDKLRGKGVDSVRSRVTNLAEFCPDISDAQLEDRLKEAFSNVYGRLPVEELSAERFQDGAAGDIPKDAERFASDVWLYGRSIPFTHQFSCRFDWGGLEILLEVNRGIVADCLCRTDAMDPALAPELAARLKGLPYEKRSLSEAVSGLRTQDSFYGASAAADDIRQLLIKELP